MASRRDTPDPLVRQIAFGLTTVGLSLRADTWRTGSGRNLSPTQAGILALLAARTGPLRPSALAASLAVSLPTASDAVGTLEAKGLVRRARDLQDGRATTVHLTDEGRRAATEFESGPAFVQDAVRALSADERGTLLRALAKVMYTLGERGETPPARMCPTCVFFAPRATRQHRAAPYRCRLLDAPLAASDLRLDCSEHDPADADESQWHRWAAE
jgi:DNA-binding MarR family transcriptional regulator